MQFVNRRPESQSPAPDPTTLCNSPGNHAFHPEKSTHHRSLKPAVQSATSFNGKQGKLKPNQYLLKLILKRGSFSISAKTQSTRKNMPTPTQDPVNGQQFVLTATITFISHMTCFFC